MLPLLCTVQLNGMGVIQSKQQNKIDSTKFIINFEHLDSCRTIIIIGGIGSFFVVKNNIDKKRLEGLRIRQRMRESNLGTYEVSNDRFKSKSAEQLEFSKITNTAH